MTCVYCPQVLDSGVTAPFWVLSRFYANAGNNAVAVWLGYSSESAYNSGKEFLCEKVVDLGSADSFCSAQKDVFSRAQDLSLVAATGFIGGSVV